MENTIASLVDLPEPTGRMPFHLSRMDGSSLLAYRDVPRAHGDRSLTSGVSPEKWLGVPWLLWIQLPGSRCGLFPKTA